jgi:hypothetical protein
MGGFLVVVSFARYFEKEEACAVQDPQGDGRGDHEAFQEKPAIILFQAFPVDSVQTVCGERNLRICLPIFLMDPRRAA